MLQRSVAEAATVIFAVVCPLIWAQGQGVLEQSDDGMSGTIKFGAPDMSDEMSNSPWVPDDLKCDACRVIAFQLWTGFTDYNAKRRSLNYKIPESDLIELMESLCGNDQTWGGYGVKQIQKSTRLSGPGLETADVPGVTASGGKWPRRLRDLCESFVGDLGELSIYQKFRCSPSKVNAVEEFLCRGEGSRNSCVGIKTKKPKSEL